MTKYLAAVTAVALLAGCASPLDKSNSATSTYSSTLSSERTYRNMLGALRECFPIGGVVIESNYYPEAKEGELNVAAIADAYYRIDHAKFKIVPTPTGSLVETTRRADMPKISAAVPEWAAGKDGGCPYGTRWEPPTATHNPYGPKPQ